MIRLLIDNKHEVFLKSDTKLRFEVNSTLFQSDAIPGSIVYPFDIPVYKNEATFNNSHFLQVNRRVRVYNVSFYFHGHLPFSGSLILKKVDAKNYKGSIIVNSFSVGFKDVKLNDLEYSDITIGGTPHSSTNVAFHAEQIVKGNIEADYTFPVIFAELFYGDLDDNERSEFNPDFGGDGGGGVVKKYPNNYNATGGNFPVNAIHEHPDEDNVYAMLPMPYLMPVIEKAFARENYTVFGDFMDDTELQKLIIANNYPLDEMYKKYFVRASHDAEVNVIGSPTIIIIDDDSTGDNEDDDGCFNTSTHEYTTGVAGYHHLYLNIDVNGDDGGGGNATSVEVTLFEDGVQVGSAVSISISAPVWYNKNASFINFHSLGVKLTLKIQFLFGGSAVPGKYKNAVLAVTNTSYSSLNQFANKLNIANHLPDIKINEFINATRNAFGLAMFYNFNSKEIEISFLKDILDLPGYFDLSGSVLSDISEIEFSKDDGFTFNIEYHNDIALYDNYEYLGAYDTFDDLPIPDHVNKIALVKNINTIEIYRKNPDTNELGWYFFSDNFYDVVTANGDKEIKPEVSTLPMHLGHDLLTCQIKITASSPAFETGVNEFPFILMFDRGMQENENGDDYPMASSVNLDLVGSSIGDYLMVMDGDEGLYQTFLRAWYEFIMTAEKVRKRFDCNVEEMIDILKIFQPQRGNKIRKCMIDNVKYIPSKFTFILSNKGIEQTEGILYKQGEIDI